MHDVVDAIASTPKVVDFANVAYGIVIGLLTFIFGEHWLLFAGFLVLNLIDWLTGYYKSHYLGIESSAEGAKGIVKKVWYWVVVGISFFVAHSFVEMGEIVGVRLDFVIMFGWLTLAMYLVNEIRSILENLVEIGVEVPFFLVKGLDVTKKILEAQAEGDDEDREDQS